LPADPREILLPYEREADRKFFVLTLLPDAGSGKGQIPHEGICYVPGVPADFDLSHLSADEIVFLPGYYKDHTDTEKEQMRLAVAFAVEHNQRVLQQRTGK
jgi:hypothetical protein